MNRQSTYDEFEYDDDDHDHARPRKFKKNEPTVDEKKKKWDRESFYDKNHDYDERR